MSDNHRLIKDVSHALKHYIDVRRREEAFDLTGVNTPPYDLHRYRFNTMFDYNFAYDKQLEHYYPEKWKIKKEGLKREKFFRNEIKYHMHKGPERKNCYVHRTYSSKPVDKEEKFFIRSRSKSAGRSIKPAAAYIPLGLLSIRSKQLPFLTKGEKKRVIQTTSMILSATDDAFTIDRHKKKSKKISPIPSPEPPSSSTDEYVLEYDPKSPKRPESPKSPKKPVEPIKKPKKPKKPKIIKEPTPEPKISLFRTIEELELLNAQEITSGQKIKYRIFVQTGSRPGSSTMAKIKLKMFGDIFNENFIKTTRWIDLEKSLTHKLPFQRSNLDIFEFEVFDIGRLIAITIGHVETDIEYSWFLDDIKIEDNTNNINYVFDFRKWFSHSSPDGKNIRTAFVHTANHVPRLESNVGVIDRYLLAHEKVREVEIVYQEGEKIEEESEREIIFDKDLYNRQKSLTQSTKVNVSSSSSSARSETKSSSTDITKSSSNKQKNSLSSTSSRKTSSISSTSSSKAIEIKSDKINVETYNVRGVQNYKSSLTSRSSSSSSSSSTSSSRTLTPPKKNIIINKTETAFIRPPSSDSNSSKIKINTNKSTHIFQNYDLKQHETSNNLNAEKAPEAEPKVVTIITNDTKNKNRRRRRSSGTSSSTLSSSSSSSTSSSSSSDSSSSSSSSDDSNKISPDREHDLKKMSEQAFKLLSENDYDGLKYLFEKSSKIILSKNSKGESLLIVACKQKHNKIVDLLVQKDDILLSTDTPDGYCPIHYCAQYDNINALKILFNNGALVDAQTNEGLTALHIAAMKGFFDICKFLVDKNANIQIKDDKSKTALDFAKSKNHNDIVMLLDAEMNNQNNSRVTDGGPRVYETQQSIISSIYEKELFANIEKNEKTVLESPFKRPERPSPIIHANKESESESDSDYKTNTKPKKSEELRSKLNSIEDQYTTIVKTNNDEKNLIVHTNMASKTRDSESESSYNSDFNNNNIKISNNISSNQTATKNKTSSISSSNASLRKEKIKPIETKTNRPDISSSDASLRDQKGKSLETKINRPSISSSDASLRIEKSKPLETKINRPDISSSDASLRENKIKRPSISSSNASLKLDNKVPENKNNNSNMGKMNNSLSDSSSNSSKDVTPRPGQIKRRGTIYDSN